MAVPVPGYCIKAADDKLRRQSHLVYVPAQWCAVYILLDAPDCIKWLGASSFCDVLNGLLAGSGAAGGGKCCTGAHHGYAWYCGQWQGQ